MKNENTNDKAMGTEAVIPGEEKKKAGLTGDKIVNEQVSTSVESLEDDLIDEFDDELEEEVEVFLDLNREHFVGKNKDGKKQRFWTYFIIGDAYGKKVRANFEAADKGGYELLSMLFDFGSQVVVSYTEEKMADTKSGKISTFGVYNAKAVAPDGNIVEYKIKPMRPSDKSIFMMLYNAKKAEIEKNKT